MSDSRSNFPGTAPTPAANGRGEVVAPRSRLFASLPVRLAGGLLWVYQKTISPALAAANPRGGCRFAPTCSHYAQDALREHGLFGGLALTARRVVKCGPWHPGGFDPVPRRTPVCVRVDPNPFVRS
jgi:putative membrane protein insertion efficiency factor